MSKDNDVVDWRTNDAVIWLGPNEEPIESASEHFSVWKEWLEWKVGPYVSRRKTNQVIIYRGKRAYLKDIELDEDWYAAVALQCLYRTEKARAEGDIDEAIRMATATSIAVNEVLNIRLWGMESERALERMANFRDQRRQTRDGKRYLKDVPDMILQMALSKHRHKRDWLKSVTDEVIHHVGKVVSAKTVSRELQERGIEDRST